MPDLSQSIPSYLNYKKNIVQLILLTAAFALAFINIYEPFGVNVWFQLTRWQLLFYSSLITLTGVLVVVLSRIIMYFWCRKRTLRYWQYFIWVFVEIAAMALFYALYIKLILHDKRFFPDLLKICIQNTALLLLLPYSVLWLYFSWKDNKKRMAELAKGQPVTDTSRLMIPFNDENGIMRFSVKLENLLYLEASDNYVNLFYLNKDKVSRFMLRNSLKTLEEQLKNNGVIRCHRRYMVNCDKIKVIRRDKDGVMLELDMPAGPDIPVTKTYMESFMSAFSQFSPSSDD